MHVWDHARVAVVIVIAGRILNIIAERRSARLMIAHQSLAMGIYIYIYMSVTLLRMRCTCAG